MTLLHKLIIKGERRNRPTWKDRLQNFIEIDCEISDKHPTLVEVDYNYCIYVEVVGPPIIFLAKYKLKHDVMYICSFLINLNINTVIEFLSNKIIRSTPKNQSYNQK